MLVRIFYGPYKSNYAIRHKPQRLYGLTNALAGLGYHVDTVPTEFINVMTIEMKDKEIFRCDIRNLKFNSDCEDDALCQKIIGAVEDMKRRLEAAKHRHTSSFSVSSSVSSSTMETKKEDVVVSSTVFDLAQKATNYDH